MGAEIKLCITWKELNVLKKALKSYKGASVITKDLLDLIESQEKMQKEKIKE